MAMRKSVTGISIVFFAVAMQAQAQTPAQAPAKPQAAAPAAKKPAAESYDRALLHPAQLKEKAPETFQVKFETTRGDFTMRSEEHTSELQSRLHLVCRLLLE